MRGLVIAGTVVLLILVGGLACTFEVSETDYVIVARFGAPQRVIETAGLHLKWPPPIDTIIRIDRRINVLDPERAEYLTADKQNVLVDSFLVWSVAEPLQYLVSVTDKSGAEARLTDIMRSEVGTILGAHPLSELVSVQAQGRSIGDVMQKITDKTARRARESLGIRVAAVRIKRLNFPQQNKVAVFRRMEAERRRIATQYRSEGEEEADKIRAQADREHAELLNTARRQAEEMRGAADAEATRIYAEAFSKDPTFYEFIRSLQAYEKIIRSNSTIVVPDDAELLKVLRHPERFTSPAPLHNGAASSGGQN